MTDTDVETETPDELRDLWRDMDPEIARMVQAALPVEYGSKSTADYTDEERALFFSLHAAVVRGVALAAEAQVSANAVDEEPGLEPYPETLDPAPLYQRIMMLRPEAQAILNQRWIERGLPAFDAPLPYDTYVAAEATVAGVEPEDETHPDTAMMALELPDGQRQAFQFRCRNEIGKAGPMEMTTGRTWHMGRIWDEVLRTPPVVEAPPAARLSIVAPSAEDLKTIASAVAWVHGDALRAGVLKLHELRQSKPRARLLKQLDEILAAETVVVDEPKVDIVKAADEVHVDIKEMLDEAQAEVDIAGAIEQLEAAADAMSKAVGEVRSAIRKLKGAS